MHKAILIVDPIASPEYLLTRFNEMGYGVIALKTINAEKSGVDYSNLPFLKMIDSTGSIEKDAEILLNLADVALVSGIYGVSSSVLYADQLLKYLFPNASNSPQTSQLRLSKYAMTEALIGQNIAHIEQIKLSVELDKSEMIQKTLLFFKKNDEKIIIKPDFGSGASVGVFLPNTTNDIINYFDKGADYLFVKGDILVQKNIVGEQYYVNTASYRGNHMVTDIGKYKKMVTANGGIACLYDEYKDVFSPGMLDLKGFAIKTLDAIEMNNGLSHIEIIKHGNIINLIEVNVRIAGAHGFLNKMSKNATGVDQIDAYIAFLEEEKLQYKKNRKIFQRVIMLRHCNSQQKKAIESLSSFSDMEVMIDAVPKKPDGSYFSIIGLLLLKSDNEKTLVQDYESVFSWGLVEP